MASTLFKWLLASCSGAAVLLPAGILPARAQGAERVLSGGVPQTVYCEEPPTLWRRAREPDLFLYCQLLARARASLWSAAERARPPLAEAARLRPNGLDVRIAFATLELAAGNPKAAVRAFQAALQHQAVALDHLRATDLLAVARAAQLASDPAVALGYYRRVILRIAALGSQTESARVLVEAALAASQFGQPADFAEAQAYLRESEHYISPRLGPARLAARALVLLRGGQPELAARVAKPAAGSSTLQWMLVGVPLARGAPSESLPVLPPGEWSALLAALDEAQDRDAAIVHWTRFLRDAPDATPFVRASARAAGGLLPSASTDELL